MQPGCLVCVHKLSHRTILKMILLTLCSASYFLSIVSCVSIQTQNRECAVLPRAQLCRSRAAPILTPVLLRPHPAAGHAGDYGSEGLVAAEDAAGSVTSRA